MDKANKKHIPTATKKTAQHKAPGKIAMIRRIPQWSIIVVLGFTALLYIRALYNGFVNWDDDYYILKNPFIKDLSVSGIKAIFSSFYLLNYHPLTTLTYLLEYSLFGLNPFPYHLLNVMLHLLNTWLVYKLVEELSGKKVTALIVSVLFAVHPMHVESVAWVSERKDVLYTAFYLIALSVYLRYLKAGGSKYYIGALLLFLCSLLSKSAAVTLPVLLVAIDLYKGRKINIKNMIGKLPFFILSLFFGILTILSQNSAVAQAVNSISISYNLLEKIFIFTYNIAYYIVNLFAPFHMSALHFFPDTHGRTLPWPYYASLLFLLLVALLIFRRSLFRKELLFGVFFFLITISVMLQIVPVGMCATSERYTYIPYIGLFYIAGQWISNINKKPLSNIVISLFGLLILVFSYQTWNRIGVWKDGNTLFTDVIKKYPDNYYAYYARGNFKKDNNDMQGALHDYDKSLELKPDYILSLRNRGNARHKLNDFKGALSDMNFGISLDSSDAEAYYNRGLVYEATGDTKSAMRNYNKAILMKPDLDEAYNNRGNVYYKSGELKPAIQDYSKAIKLKPGWAEPYYNRGMAYYSSGDMKQAMLDYQKAISLKPGWAEVYNNIGALKLNTNDINGAIENFSNAIKANPDYASAYYNRGIARLKLRDTSGICADWDKALQLGYHEATGMIKEYCK